MEGSAVVKGTSDKMLVVIRITIRLWWRFALSKCLKYDDCHQMPDFPNYKSGHYGVGHNDLNDWFRD